MSNINLSANLLKILNLRNVVMEDSEEVIVKLKRIILDGPKHLQVITDFDSTLTKSHVNGNPTSHSIDIVNRIPTLSKEFETGCGELFTKFNDTAYSLELSEEQKQEVLNKWWAGYVELLTKENLTLEEVQLSTENTNTPLRDGCAELISLLLEHQVPILVISAGIGDVISHTLQNFQPQIVANFLQTGDKGQISGFKEPYVSVYNKHKFALPVDPTRHNVLLMGDSLGDSNMADNVPNTKNILKVGFFSQQDETVLEKYRNRYDIVLVEDQTMDFPTALLTEIIGQIDRS